MAKEEVIERMFKGEKKLFDNAQENKVVTPKHKARGDKANGISLSHSLSLNRP